MLYILLAALAYTVAILLNTVANRVANTNLVAAVVTTVSAVIPVVTVLPMLNKKGMQGQGNGVWWAVAAGVFIAVFTMAINKAYAENKVAIVAPAVLGGSIFLSAILSYFFFKEKISPAQGLGLAFLGAGLVLIIYARLTGK